MSSALDRELPEVIQQTSTSLMLSKQLKEFTLFPKLPMELRIKIYKHASLRKNHTRSSTGKVHLAVVVTTNLSSQWVFKIHRDSNTHNNVFDIGLLRANHEARDVFNKISPHELPHFEEGGLIRYDPAKTILDIENASEMITVWYLRNVPGGKITIGQQFLGNCQWPLYVQHISFKKPNFTAECHFCMLSHFPQLKSLTWIRSKLDDSGVLGNILLRRGRVARYRFEVAEANRLWQLHGSNDGDLRIQFTHSSDQERLIITEEMLEEDVVCGFLFRKE